MFGVFYQLSMLAFESQQAIWLRTMRLSLGGPGAQREARRMVSEKVAAGQVATGKLLTGSSPEAVVQSYRRKVRKNVKRLSKGKMR